MTTNHSQAKPEKSREIVIHIDKEPFKLTVSVMTVRELLELAEEDPNETALVLRHGNDQQKYTRLDEIVPLRNGMHFVVFHNGPTSVS